MTKSKGLVRPRWGLYKNGELVLVHDKKEMLEGNVREFMKQEGSRSSTFEIKPNTIF
ncbi:hypothetical protein NZD89_08645 [Alicyclobacillus fastidiosus]|uniref:Uncharacterized protein n=1 Tax=Alicyclobacillus fastidiosus TaxID=392011 RepID=A0ABY6ZMU4_9BACL|nr:hypothetical protein [Alicyclobacillus fastidiosus]WAH43436.1 hypothetical protein NZD89_08645 [Alicyclobacillus fastidiosus]GMA59589.1 hypothetical protein GCM10025859_00290 [Alicyclobacillus fastidiosus]GMA65515.1 hypothetical protein GCM10025859_59550 [Alicyclobacillus fastidiosus]